MGLNAKSSSSMGKENLKAELDALQAEVHALKQSMPRLPAGSNPRIAQRFRSLRRLISRLQSESAPTQQEDEEFARLAAIVRCSDDAILSKSLDGTVRTWNSGARHLFGFSRAEIVGKSIRL